MEAVRRVREASFKKLETFTPFPVHGLEHVMGLKRSKIPFVTLIMGIVGCLVGFGFQAWTSAFAWPLNVGGKPMISWPAFIPVTFETTILIGGVSTVIALFVAIKLPSYKNNVLDERFTNDRFGLLVESDDAQYDAVKLSELLKNCQAEEVRTVG